MRLADPYRQRDKPRNEPYRDWDLESCDHCRSLMALTQDRCDNCDARRSAESCDMRDRVLGWRQSPQGQGAYAQMKHDRDSMASFIATLEALRLSVAMFIMGTIVGLIWQGGIMLGLGAAAITFVIARWAISAML